MSKIHRSTLALVLLLPTLLAQSGAADPHASTATRTTPRAAPSVAAEPSVSDAVSYDPNGGIDLDLLINDQIELPQSADPSCSWSTPATSAPAPGTNTKVAFIYMTPSPSDTSWGDSHLDQARLCANGNAYSKFDKMYRNMATFTSTELNTATNSSGGTIGPKRLYAFTKTHTWSCTTGSCARSLYTGYRFQTTNTFKYWSDLSHTLKLQKVQEKLSAAGLNDPNVRYVVFLHAQQHYDDPSTPVEDERFVLGRAQGQYAYVVRNKWNGRDYKTAMSFGCNVQGEAVVLHETTHLLGASHVAAAKDLMFGKSDPALHFGGGMELDHGTINYRDPAYTNGFVTSGSTFANGSYLTCP